SPGEPIATGVRSFMEARLGHDFGRVRIHAGEKAAASARSLGARAYAFGHHVVFGAGLYRPNTTAGRRLLAHELAHVSQQSGGDFGRGAGRSSLRAPVSGVVQLQVEPGNEEEEVTGAELFERASSTRLAEV